MKSLTPNGNYWVKITGQGLGQTSTGNIQMVLEFQPLGLVNPQNREEYLVDESLQNITRRFYRVLNENTMPFATEELKVMGFKGDSFEQIDPRHPRHWSFKDQLVMMYCQQGTNHKGEPREEWNIARSSPMVREEAPKDKLRSLDAMFQKNLQYLRGDQPFMPGNTGKKQESSPAKKKSVTVPAGASQEITDDDVPF